MWCGMLVLETADEIFVTFCSRINLAIRSRNRESDRSAANVGRSTYCNRVDKSVDGCKITSRARGRRYSDEEVAGSVAKLASAPATLAGAGGDIEDMTAIMWRPGETISVSSSKAQVIMQQSKQSNWLIDQKSWQATSLLAPICSSSSRLLSLVLQINSVQE